MIYEIQCMINDDPHEDAIYIEWTGIPRTWDKWQEIILYVPNYDQYGYLEPFQIRTLNRDQIPDGNLILELNDFPVVPQAPGGGEYVQYWYDISGAMYLYDWMYTKWQER